VGESGGGEGGGEENSCLADHRCRDVQSHHTAAVAAYEVERVDCSTAAEV
jgi:hypothetical protein